MLLTDLPAGVDTLVRYGELLSGLDIGILSHSSDGIVEYANDAARNWLGVDGLSGLGLDNAWSLLDADGEHLALSQLPAVRALCAGKPVTGRVVTAFRDVSAGRQAPGREGTGATAGG